LSDYWDKKLRAAAAKGQLLRWFHERSVRELKAMRTAFEQAQQPKPQKDTTNCKSSTSS
jgi:hypothetical protein